VWNAAGAGLASLDAADWQYAVLIRRHVGWPEELAYYFVFMLTSTPLTEVMRAAEGRWVIEECFRLTKGRGGLNQYEVHGWQRRDHHITLAMEALAVLTGGAVKAWTWPALFIPLTVPRWCRLLRLLLCPRARPADWHIA